MKKPSNKNKNENIVKYTKKELEELKAKSKTDFSKIDDLKDDEIDYSDIPELDEEFWANAEIVDNAKKAVSLRIDMDVLDWFKAQDGRYQTLMNKVLREYMKAMVKAHYHHHKNKSRRR